MAENKMTKSEFVSVLARESGLDKKQAQATLESLSKIVIQQLKQGGEVMIPGLLKLNVVEKPATPEREGINPFTKQPTIFKAKPARKVIKARPVKALKDAL